MNATILIIQTDGDNVTQIKKEIFTAQGYGVLEATTIREGENVLTWESPDIIISDVMLADGCGLAFCQKLRRNSQIPMLFKCALGTEDEIVQCLQAGGDDCLPPPYDTRLALAKVEALLRRMHHGLRVQATTTADFAVGAISFSPTFQRAYLDGKDMMLRPKEFALLRILMLNENKTIGPDVLYEAVWGQPAGGSRRALISCVSRLRRKIEGMGYCIEVERGVGYKLVK